MGPEGSFGFCMHLRLPELVAIRRQKAHTALAGQTEEPLPSLLVCAPASVTPDGTDFGPLSLPGPAPLSE